MSRPDDNTKPVSGAEYVDRILTPSWLRDSGDENAARDRKNAEQATSTAVSIITNPAGR